MASLPHGLNHGVKRDVVCAVAAQRHSSGIDGFYGSHGVALDAGDLHEAANRVAGESKIVLHADLGGILDLPWPSTERSRESSRSH